MQTKIVVYFLNVCCSQSFPSTLMATQSFGAQAKQCSLIPHFPLHSISNLPTDIFGSLFKISRIGLFLTSITTAILKQTALISCLDSWRNFFFKCFINLFMRHKRDKQRCRKREKQAPCGEPHEGLDPRTLGSWPEPNADTQPLSHPGAHEETF